MNRLRVTSGLHLPAIRAAIHVLIVLSSAGLLASGCAGHDHRHDHPDEDYTDRVNTADAATIRLWMEQERDFTIVDVRSEGEYDSHGRAPGSELHSWSIYNRDPERNEAFIEEMKARFEPDETILLLCSHAMRASQAAAALQEQAGFTAVYVFPGGYEGHHMAGYPAGDGWKAADLPIEEW